MEFARDGWLTFTYLFGDVARDKLSIFMRQVPPHLPCRAEDSILVSIEEEVPQLAQTQKTAFLPAAQPGNEPAVK